MARRRFAEASTDPHRADPSPCHNFGASVTLGVAEERMPAQREGIPRMDHEQPHNEPYRETHSGAHREADNDASAR